MNALPLDTLNSLIRWVSYVYGRPGCIDLNYDNYINVHSQIEVNSTAATTQRRQAYFALCTQVGGFAVTTESEISLFPNRVPLEFHYRACEGTFGPK